jgi:fructokinase
MRPQARRASGLAGARRFLCAIALGSVGAAAGPEQALRGARGSNPAYPLPAWPAATIVRMRIGIDLGGTKIEGICLDEAGSQLARRRVPAPRGDYGATVAAVAALVQALETETGRRGTVGVGIPGALSRLTGLVKNANSTWLIGRPLARDLEAALGRKVRLANDANCFALSEATDGAGRGERVVFGVILGTGVGGGIVVDGRVLVGPNAISGEWGHNPLPLPAAEDLPLRPCYCGRKGCIETYLCGPALERDGGAASEAAVARYESRLARALAGVINLLDPDVIVLGGGVSNVDRLYDTVPRLWGAHVFSDRVDTRLARPAHGDSSGVRGAAWLWGGAPLGAVGD